MPGLRRQWFAARCKTHGKHSSGWNSMTAAPTVLRWAPPRRPRARAAHTNPLPWTTTVWGWGMPRGKLAAMAVVWARELHPAVLGPRAGFRVVAEVAWAAFPAALVVVALVVPAAPVCPAWQEGDALLGARASLPLTSATRCPAGRP